MRSTERERGKGSGGKGQGVRFQDLSEAENEQIGTIPLNKADGEGPPCPAAAPPPPQKQQQ